MLFSNFNEPNNFGDISDKSGRVIMTAILADKGG